MKRFLLLSVVLLGATRAVFAVTCTGRSTVTATPGGTVRLHFEDAYRGYAPAFGLPTVTKIDDLSLFSIVQPVADTANSEASGAPPSSTICHAEELDLGPLADGYHQVLWRYQVNVNGIESSGNAASFSFDWHNGTALCTSDPGLMTASALEGAEFDVAVYFLEVNYFPFGQLVERVNVEGHTVTIDVAKVDLIGGPFESFPSCQAYKATIAPLPAGEYTVVWRFGGGSQVFTTSLAVVKPARRRSAHH